MQSNYKRFLAALLLAAMMLSLFTGCQTTTPELNHTHGSTGSTVQVPGSTGTNPTTGTTKPTESTPGTDVTVPVTQPTDPTQPSTQPTDPTQPTTQPTDPTQPTNPTQPETKPSDPTQPTECSHNWSDWTVQKEAGCETDGTKIRICQLCSNAQQQTITKTGHAFSGWKTTAATCTANGSKTRTCSKCNKTESESIPATGHNWDEGKVTTTPTTCDDIGVKTFTCKTCGQKKVTQITGSHSFGEWEYEEYTYQVTGSFGKVYTRTSHRKVRYCTKCHFKEAVNTENHVCEIGSAVHTVTEYKGDCQTLTTYRSTCTVCGWSTTFDRGEYGSHVTKSETKHLTDYTAYTNELDVKIFTCTVCGLKEHVYTLGRGHDRYHMKYSVALNTGTAYANQNAEAYPDDRFIKHPTWQTVTRNEKFDAEGYLIQWDYIWHDAETGTRYSYTVRTDDIPAMFEAAGYDLSKYEGYNSVCYQFIIDGDKVRPYKITFT